MERFTRKQALAYRLRMNYLDGARLPAGSLALAARSGLQDGSPRSALLSLAARVEGVQSGDWRADGLVQVFGPRGAVYLVPDDDFGVFTLGLLPRDPDRVAQLTLMAAQVHEVLAGQSMRQAAIVDALPSLGGSRGLRWAAALGTLRAEWDTVDTIVHPSPAPAIEAESARLELGRRFFRHLGPATVADLQWWLDGLRSDAVATVAALADELVEVSSAGREGLVLTDALPEAGDRLDPHHVLLLPPDDVYINRLTRELLIPDPQAATRLWPQAPPPGALVVGGEVCGTWRRRGGSVTVSTWQRVDRAAQDKAEAIAAAWPIDSGVEVTWQSR